MDALIAGLGAGTAAAALVIGESEEQVAIQGGVGAGVAVLFGLSAVLGATRVSKCRTLLEQADENAANRAELFATGGTGGPASRHHASPVPPPPPRKLTPMQCFADVDCGSGRMCDLGKCVPLRVAP